MPPTAIRRPLTVTAWLVMSSLGLLLSPFLLAIAAIASALLRRPQPLLIARLLVTYFARELGALTACGALWLISGFGAAIGRRRVQQLHHRLLRWFAHGFARRALDLLDIDVTVELSDDTAAALDGEAPLLFFSRHAGPGDTVLLIDLLATRYARHPSVVFKRTLAIDPTIDLIGHRLPHALINTADRAGAEQRIEQVSAGLGPRGVLLLFPEGGNITFSRRRAALRKLRRRVPWHLAASAQSLVHVMPPHATGALAALRGNPQADVIFGAHTGLGLAAFPRELWRDTPIGRTFTAHMWRVPAADRPTDPDAATEWLYDWWKRMDRWLDECGEPAPTA